MTRQRPFANQLLWLAVLTLLTAFCLLPSALGQSATATLSGTVEDEQGAVIPGAAITVLNPSTALQRQATTNDQGSFTVTLHSVSVCRVLTSRLLWAVRRIRINGRSIWWITCRG